MRTILILAANPKGTERVRLDEEVKKIKRALERSKKRDQFKVIDDWAVTDDDLRRTLLDHEPEVVHFAGHGTGDGQAGTGRDLIPEGEVDAGGLVFEDDVGNVQLISGDALAGLFALCSDSVKCVVLNACLTEAQANAITQHIDFVVGMKKAIGDPAAIKFAIGFYDALFAGRDFEKAFNFGRSAIDLKEIPEHLTPIFKKKVGAVTGNTSSPTGGVSVAGTTRRRIGKPGKSVTPTAEPTSGSSIQTTGPIRLFYSYSHKDKVLRDELEEALALLNQQGLIAEWHDRRIGAGDEWKGAIDENLQKAQIILLLVSASFIASKYCWDVEVKQAIARHDRGVAKVIPVILRSCDWQEAPFGKLQALPKDGKAVRSWAKKDEAWTDVAKGIRSAVKARTANAVSPPSGVGGNAGAGERDPSVSAPIGEVNGPGNDVRKAVQERIERRLKQLKYVVLRRLVEELRGKGDPTFEDGTDPIPFLLAILLERRRFITIAGLAEIHRELCEKPDWEQADIVVAIFEEATPLVIDQELADKLWHEINIRMTAFYYVPDHHSTTLEVLMARTDRKGMKFKIPENEVANDEYEGTSLLRRAGKPPIEAPTNSESLAKSILVDLCESQDVRDSAGRVRTLTALVERLAGVLMRNSRGESKERTLYCFHRLPEDPTQHSAHTTALTLIRDELNKLKRAKPEPWGDMPQFIFLLLAETSELEGLRSIIVSMLRTRFKHERNRTGHAASQ